MPVLKMGTLDFNLRTHFPQIGTEGKLDEGQTCLPAGRS